MTHPPQASRSSPQSWTAPKEKLVRASTRRRSSRTQEERSASTREAVLDATIVCLIRKGYARTTTTEVARLAGVSRGAQLHQFPTKAQLVVSAVAHLAQRRRDDLVREATRLEAAGDRTERLLDLLRESFSGPLFYAALELWVAARSDPNLRQQLLPFERNVAQAMAELWVELAGDAGRDRDARAAFELTLHVLRGMSVQAILRDEDPERDALFETWKQWIGDLLAQPGPRRADGGLGGSDPPARRGRSHSEGVEPKPARL